MQNEPGADPTAPAGVIFGFFKTFLCIFMLFAAFMVYSSVVSPLMSHLKSSDWIPTPCRIELSQVFIPNGVNARRWRKVDIQYAYTFKGQSYHSKRYDLFASAINRYGGANNTPEEIVSRFPIGLTTTCYVDPKNPQEAVLNREIPGSMVWGLIPLVFFLVPLGMLAFIRRMQRRLTTGPSR